MSENPILPRAMSTIAERVDPLFNGIFWLSVVFFVGIVAAMIVLLIRGRRKAGVAAGMTPHMPRLELFWTFAPLVIIAVLFHYGWSIYLDQAVAPDGALEVNVRGQQWSWSFEHVQLAGNNCAEQGEGLTVPVNTPVKLILSSNDVIHSFFVPEFRVKRDAVPGMYTTVWFEATKTGDAQVFCAEYCGAPDGVAGNVGHSAMLSTVHVVTREAYDAHMAQICRRSEVGPVWGKEIYESRCKACHSTDGRTQVPGPNLRGLWGTQAHLTGGTTVAVDEEYLRESIQNPTAKVVDGYPPIMPPFTATDEEVRAVIAYIRSLSSGSSQGAVP